jgi:tRNA threonylcarbamoyladenosine biosynthesis protein TsaE
MQPNYLELISHSPEQTQRIGIRLGKFSQAGDVILLTGELGAGKTCLVQGIAWGLGVDDYASSPSFVLIKQYQGRLSLYHIDFYRIDRVEEVIALGLEDYLYGDGISVVEWAEKGSAVLPEEHLLIKMEYLGENERKLRLEAEGKRYREMLSELKGKWNSL